MLRRSVLIATLALAILPVAAGAGRVSRPLPCGTAAPSGFRCFGDSTLSFIRPGAWRPHDYPLVSSFTSELVYLSNQALHDPCVQTKRLTDCTTPLEHLRRDGVLVLWEADGFPGFKLVHPTSRIGGLPARASTSRPDAECASIGGRESIVAVIARRLVWNSYAFTACLRGPHLRRAERYVRRLLASTRFVDS